VDPETAQVEIKRYVVVHDCGRVINPMIVRARSRAAWRTASATRSTSSSCTTRRGSCSTLVHGLPAPTATDVPNVETTHRKRPRRSTPWARKVLGEAGVIPTGALFAQAVEDALAGSGWRSARSRSAPIGCSS